MMASVFRFQLSKLFEVPCGERRVRNLFRQDTRLVGLHRFIRAADDIVGSNRLNVTGLVEHVRAEQRFLGLFKKQACVPAVRQMGRLAIAEAELARRKRFAVGKRAGFAANKVIGAD